MIDFIYLLWHSNFFKGNFRNIPTKLKHEITHKIQIKSKNIIEWLPIRWTKCVLPLMIHEYYLIA